MNKDIPIWDGYVQRPSFGVLSGNIKTDVCVVGLGGSGLSAALHAAELGYNVIGIDSKFIAAEAAGRNGGFLLNGFAKFYHKTRKQVGVEENKRVYKSTIKEMQWLKDRAPNCMKETGVLRIAESDKEIKDCDEHLSALRKDGFDAEYYEGPQGVGILIPSDGIFNPVHRAVVLANLAKNRGAKLYNDTKAVSFKDNFVKTQFANIEAGLVIVAVDGYLHKIFPELSTRIQPVRLQMASTDPSKKKIPMPVYANFGYDYWQQMPNGRVVIGGGRQVNPDSEYTDVRETTEEIQSYLKSKLRSIGVYEDIDKSWAGVVGYTDDGLPIKEQMFNDVWAVGGYNGTGNLIGPMITKEIINEWKN